MEEEIDARKPFNHISQMLMTCFDYTSPFGRGEAEDKTFKAWAGHGVELVKSGLKEQPESSWKASIDCMLDSSRFFGWLHSTLCLSTVPEMQN